MKRINEPESIGEEFWGCFGDVLGMFWGRFSVVKKTTGTNKFPLTISL